MAVRRLVIGDGQSNMEGWQGAVPPLKEVLNHTLTWRSGVRAYLAAHRTGLGFYQENGTINAAGDSGARGQTPIATLLQDLSAASPDDLYAAQVVAHGGRSIDWLMANAQIAAPWTSSNARTAVAMDVFNNRWLTYVVPSMTELVAALRALGDTPIPHMVMWDQGEADMPGSDTDTWRGHYTSLLQIQSQWERLLNMLCGTDQAVPMVFPQKSFRIVDSRDVSRAQLVAGLASPKHICIGPTYYYDHFDDTHYTQEWVRIIGRLAARAFNAENWKPCHIEYATMPNSTTVIAHCHVPTGDLRINTDDIAAVTNWGFSLADNSGAVSINNVTVEGSKVVLTLASAWAGIDLRLRYAVANYVRPRTSNADLQGGANGNISDSAADVYEGRKCPNYLCHFDELVRVI